MDALIMAGQLILAFSILVFVHELGHFLAAKYFGIKVEKFFIFFDAWDFKLFSFKRGETEYGFGWLPFGGYVKIAGMVDESLDKEQLKKAPEHWEFRAKPAWQRLIVLIAGIVMNLILGVIISSFVLYNYAEKYLPVSNVTDGIYAYELGQEVGLKTGDRIVAINGKPAERFSDIAGSPKLIFAENLTVIRDNKEVNIPMPRDFFKKVKEKGLDKFIGFKRAQVTVAQVVPGMGAEKAGLKELDVIKSINGVNVGNAMEFTQLIKSHPSDTLQIGLERDKKPVAINVITNNEGKIGVMAGDVPDYPLENYTVGKSIKYGTKDAFEGLYYGSIFAIGKMFTGDIKPQESFVGPIGMARIYGSTWDWAKFWKLTGVISMVLAFMNLLPIPALDGGHILFVLIEMVTRRPVNEKIMEYAQYVGMAILLGLMVFVIGNDIFNIFK